jgi:hypothetical protein
MSPLYFNNGKLLIVNGKLATNSNCCCEDEDCTTCDCGQWIVELQQSTVPNEQGQSCLEALLEPGADYYNNPPPECLPCIETPGSCGCNCAEEPFGGGTVFPEGCYTPDYCLTYGPPAPLTFRCSSEAADWASQFASVSVSFIFPLPGDGEIDGVFRINRQGCFTCRDFCSYGDYGVQAHTAESRAAYEGLLQAAGYSNIEFVPYAPSNLGGGGSTDPNWESPCGYRYYIIRFDCCAVQNQVYTPGVQNAGCDPATITQNIVIGKEGGFSGDPCGESIYGDVTVDKCCDGDNPLP